MATSTPTRRRRSQGLQSGSHGNLADVPPSCKAPEGWRSPRRFADFRNHRVTRSVLECGGPPPLFPEEYQTVPMLTGTTMVSRPSRHCRYGCYGSQYAHLKSYDLDGSATSPSRCGNTHNQELHGGWGRHRVYFLRCQAHRKATPRAECGAPLRRSGHLVKRFSLRISGTDIREAV